MTDKALIPARSGAANAAGAADSPSSRSSTGSPGFLNAAGSSPGACPDATQLTCFCAGKLADAEFDSIAVHVEGCLTCGRWIESHLEDDTVAAMLRRPDPLKPYASEPGLTSMGTGAGKGGEALDNQDESVAARGPSTYGRRQDSAASRVPHKLGSYRIVESLGAGGMGEVYKAIDETLHCAVAIKILHPHRVSDERILARFYQEMKAVGSLDHPNIVRARTAGEHDGLHYLVMDYIDGFDLKQFVRRWKQVGVGEACAIAAQVAHALQCIHDHGLVHRDIKPSNLMLDASGVVKVLDLGLVQWQKEQPESLTVSRDLLGTVDYMAPEQASDPRTANIRADIYSLGCTIFELLTGRAPFSGKSFATLREKLQAHHVEPPPSAMALNAAVPKGLDAVLRRAMAKRPEDRFASPRELREALAEFAGDVDLSTLIVRTPAATPQEPLSASAKKLPDRRRWLMWAIGGTAAAVTGVLGWIRDLFRKPSATEPVWFQRLAIEKLPGMSARVSRVWDDQLSAAVISTSDWCLVRAGEADGANATLSVEFEMPRWDGQCGLYLGYGMRDVDGKQCAVFQFLELYAESPGQWRLRRRMAYFPQGSSVPAMLLSGPDGAVYRERVAAVSMPQAGKTNRLDIRVGATGLSELDWNGEPVPELVADEANRPMQAKDYVGYWGIATKATIWIKSVQAGS